MVAYSLPISRAYGAKPDLNKQSTSKKHTSFLELYENEQKDY